MALLLLPSLGCLQGPNPVCMAVRWGVSAGTQHPGCSPEQKDPKLLCESSL